MKEKVIWKMSLKKTEIENDENLYSGEIQELEEDFWSELLQLFYNNEYSKGERKVILERWAKMLSTKGTERWDHAELLDDARRLILRLYKITNETNEELLLDCLACLIVKDKFTVEQLNDFLKKYQFQYYYTTNGEWKLLRNNCVDRKEMVFISHSYEDREYVYKLVEFLEDIGLKSEQIVCSSIPKYAAPCEDIYDFLKSCFRECDLSVIYVLSENYYKSVACLNEMGATWILPKKYTSILLPGFVFEQKKGAVNPIKKGIKLDESDDKIKYRLKQFIASLQAEFALKALPDREWQRYVETFISKIKNMNASSSKEEQMFRSDYANNLF